MRRPPVLLVPIVVVAVGGVLLGSPVVALMFAPLATIAIVWGRWSFHRPTPDIGWSGPPVDVAVRPAAERQIEVSVWRRRGEVVRALGRIEGRMLALSPAFGVGLGFCVLLLVLFTFVFGGDNTTPWSENLQTAPWFVHPLAGLTVLASHRAVTRATRDGTAELFDTCPTNASTRTMGHLTSAWMPTLVATVFLGVLLVGVHLASALVHGPISSDDAADVVAAALLPTGAVALGVASGRWLRYTVVPVVVVLGVAVATTVLNGVGGHGWNPYTALSTAPTIEGPSPVFTDRPAVFHLLWIVGLIGLMATIAVLRDRRDRAVAMAAAVAVGVLVVAGIGATRPLSSSSADRIADLVAAPEDHQICEYASARIQICTYAHHAELLPAFVEGLAPTVAMLPPSAGSFVLRQRYLERVDSLPPRVRSRLVGVDLRRPPGEVALTDVEDVDYFPAGPSFALAFVAVGLPELADVNLMPAVATGQARAVVALWLATSGVDPEHRMADLRSPAPNSPDPFERGVIEEVGACSAPSVAVSAQDLQAARAIAGLPDDEVLAVLEADWRRWVDPAAGADDLLRALGLAPVGPFDHIEPRPGSTC